MTDQPDGDTGVVTTAIIPDEGLSQSQIDLLKKLRSEVEKGLLPVIKNVRKGQFSIDTYAQTIAKTRADIDTLMQELDQAGSGDDYDVGAISDLRNTWEDIRFNPLVADPKAATKLEAQAQLQHLNILEEGLQGMLYTLGTLIIPSEVEKWLNRADPGDYLPFHYRYANSLPLVEQREKVLNQLDLKFRRMDGALVDVANGVIYRYAKETQDIRRSMTWVTGVFIGLTLVITLLCFVPATGVDDWPTAKDIPLVLSGWLAVLVGVMVHIAVDSKKREQVNLAVFDIRNLPYVIDARLGQFIGKLVMAAIGFIGFTLATGISNVSMINAFLVGYSLDSIIELFGTSLEQQATAQVGAIQKRLGVS